jgi:hypothetical protein
MLKTVVDAIKKQKIPQMHHLTMMGRDGFWAELGRTGGDVAAMIQGAIKSFHQHKIPSDDIHGMLNNHCFWAAVGRAVNAGGVAGVIKRSIEALASIELSAYDQWHIMKHRAFWSASHSYEDHFDTMLSDLMYVVTTKFGIANYSRQRWQEIQHDRESHYLPDITLIEWNINFKANCCLKIMKLRSFWVFFSKNCHEGNVNEFEIIVQSIKLRMDEMITRIGESTSSKCHISDTTIFQMFVVTSPFWQHCTELLAKNDWATPFINGNFLFGSHFHLDAILNPNPN